MMPSRSRPEVMMVDEQWRATSDEAPESTAADRPPRDCPHAVPGPSPAPVVAFPGPGERGPGVPTPTSRLVGRAAELTFLSTLIADPDVRLITLTGPGGIGKTRLALAAAAAAKDRFPDGVCFVELSAIDR